MEYEIFEEDGGRVLRHVHASRSRADVLAAWTADEDWTSGFVGLLAACPFEGAFWETPPSTRDSLERPFEFVLIESRAVAGLAPESEPFAEHLTGPDDVAAFWNLGGDALLVAPRERGDPRAYAHLLAFARRAPHEQGVLLWREVARSVRARLSERPLWVSTSGLGVGWLHVRLDTRPKYYQYAPYRDPSQPPFLTSS